MRGWNRRRGRRRGGGGIDVLRWDGMGWCICIFLWGAGKEAVYILDARHVMELAGLVIIHEPTFSIRRLPGINHLSLESDSLGWRWLPKRSRGDGEL